MTQQPLFDTDPATELHRLRDGLVALCAEPLDTVTYVSPCGVVDELDVVAVDDIAALLEEA